MLIWIVCAGASALAGMWLSDRYLVRKDAPAFRLDGRALDWT